jgi:hypothetical protein
MQEFLQQKSGSQLRMNHPEKMKAHAVPAAKINRQRSGSRPPNQTHGRIVPRRVGDLRMRKLPSKQHSTLVDWASKESKRQKVSLTKFCTDRQLPDDASLLEFARFREFVSERRKILGKQLRQLL